MTTSVPSSCPALKVGFESRISLTIHDAFLPAAGLLQCDPVAKVHVVTVKTIFDGPSATNAREGGGGGVRVTVASRKVGSTKRKLFTSHPVFDETISFAVDEGSCLTSLAGTAPSLTAAQIQHAVQFGALPKTVVERETIQDYVVVTLEDTDGRSFFGQAYCPFSPHCPSTAPASAPVRVMLLPRNAQDPRDPLYVKDTRALAALQLDDFGFVSVSWRVHMVPHGGAVRPAQQAVAEAAPQFPLGLTLRAVWLAPQFTYQRGTQYTTSVEFGGADRFVFADGKPLFLTIRSTSQLERVTFHCCVQNIVKPEVSHDVAVALPLPSWTTGSALDRDVHWTAPVRTALGDDLGMLLATLRLSRRPLEGNTPVCPNHACSRINDPLHQEEASHVVDDFDGRPMPDAPAGCYQPIYWESEEHISFATERRWKQNCVKEAQPTPEHVRHLFEVLMGRAQLDAGVARAASGFFNVNAAELTAGDLKEFMVACAFHSKAMTVQEAARFCFIALRRDVEDAVATEEVHYLLEHSLVGKTVDMPRGELRRWTRDIFGDVAYVAFDDFHTFFIRNYAMWGAFGVPLVVDMMSSSAQRHHHMTAGALGASTRFSDPTAVRGTPTPAAAPASHPAMVVLGTTGMEDNANPDGVTTATVSRMLSSSGLGSATDATAWRTFIVRVESTRKGFSVTAHANDTVWDVMSMVETSTGIKAARQEWRINGEKLMDPKTTIGNTTLGLLSALKGGKSGGGSGQGLVGTQEVLVREQEETVAVTFTYRNKKWTEQIQCNDKILKVRAAVQKKTLIPLSRCALRVKSATTHASTVLQDRHPISHYKLQPGDVVEVSQE